MLLLIGLSTLLTIYVGGKQAIAGNITTGNIAEFIIYVNMLTWPMASIGCGYLHHQRAAASQKRINEFLNTDSRLSLNAETKNRIEGQISFKNVSFCYPENNLTALTNISVTFKKHQFIAVVGKTGSGKSTLVQLLTRMYDASQGIIEIDGQAIDQINLKTLRKSISIAPQEAMLFSDTIANNIAFGIEKKATQQDIEDVARKADIHNNIIDFPMGYSTTIGERGVTLSGGQKQRISIARAFLNHPPF